MLYESARKREGYQDATMDVKNPDFLSGAHFNT